MPKRAQFQVTPEHIGWAALHLHDLEREPRIHGGKAGAEQVRQRIAAKRNVGWLVSEYERQSVEIPEPAVSGVRRLDGRDGDGVSMPGTQMGAHPGACNGNESATMRKSS